MKFNILRKKSKPIKNIRFFLNLAKEFDLIDETIKEFPKEVQQKGCGGLRNHILNGIMENPNVKKEYFKIVMDSFRDRKLETIRRELYRGFSSRQHDPEILRWIWNFGIEDEITESPEEIIGWVIIDNLSDDHPLRDEIIAYFLSLKDRKDTRVDTGDEIPSIYYSFFLKKMIEEEPSMEQIDYYVGKFNDHYNKNIEYFLKNHGSIQRELLRPQSLNRNLSEERILDILNQAKSIDRWNKNDITSNLLECNNIPLKNFHRILDRKMKSKKPGKTYNEYFMMAARNTQLFDEIFDFICEYCENKIDAHNQRYLVLCSAISNESLSRDQYQRLCSIVLGQDHWEHPVIWVYGQLNSLVLSLLKRDEFLGEMHDKIFDLWIDFLVRYGDQCEGGGMTPGLGGEPWRTIGSFKLSDEIYSSLHQKLSRNYYQFQMYAGLIGHIDLTKEQYESICDEIEPIFFPIDKWLFTKDHPFRYKNDISNVLENWASSRYVLE